MWGATRHSDKVGKPLRMFQFTHPVWGATGELDFEQLVVKFQFTHPVWGATLKLVGRKFGSIVSIHAPRVGCDRQVVTTLYRH